MTSKAAIEYLRTITHGDVKAREALDLLAVLGGTADTLAKLHEEETRKTRAAQ